MYAIFGAAVGCSALKIGDFGGRGGGQDGVRLASAFWGGRDVVLVDANDPVVAAERLAVRRPPSREAEVHRIRAAVPDASEGSSPR